MRPRITKVRIRGFKSLEDCTFEPHPELTVVVGANATGKSTLLDAIQIASDFARMEDGQPLNAYHRGAIAGFNRMVHLEDLTWSNRKSIEMDLWIETVEKSYHWSFEVAARGTNILIVREEVRDEGNELLLERNEGGARIRGADGRLRPLGTVNRRMAIWSCYDEVSYPSLFPLWKFVSGFCSLSLVPSAMREPAHPDTELPRPDRYGSDLSARLHALQTSGGQGILNLVNEMTFVGWADLRTPVRGGSVEPEILEERRSWATKLSEASDGTLFQTYLMTLLLHPPADTTVLLIDEPSLPIFLSARERTAEILGALSQVFQVIAVSNDDIVVSALGNLDNTWRTVRTAGGATQLARFEDSESVARVGMGPAILEDSPRLDETGE